MIKLYAWNDIFKKNNQIKKDSHSSKDSAQFFIYFVAPGTNFQEITFVGLFNKKFSFIILQTDQVSLPD